MLCDRSSSRMATTCATIFALPSEEARISTPRPAATLRSPVTASSRASTIITAHAGTSPISTRERNAAAVSSLSARGSRRIPSLVTSFRRRAKKPSR
jgi:hypothetical protein